MCALLLAGCGRRHTAVVVHSTDTVRIASAITERIVRDTVSVALPAASAERTTSDTVSHLSIPYARSMARINPDGTLTHTLLSTRERVSVPVEHRLTTHTDTVTRLSSREIPVAAEPCLSAWERFRLAAFWPMAVAILLLCYFPLRKLSNC